MTKLRQQFRTLLQVHGDICIGSNPLLFETAKKTFKYFYLLFSVWQDSGLINKKESTLQLSSSERSMRHGEVKQLRLLKKEYHMAAPRKKKVLKFEDGIDAADGSDQEGDNDGIDIRDVEFRLRNDTKQVKVFTYSIVRFLPIDYFFHLLSSTVTDITKKSFCIISLGNRTC